MSEENTSEEVSADNSVEAQESNPQQDVIKNLKSEFARKTLAIQEQNQFLAQQIQMLTEQMTQRQSNQLTPEDDLPDDFYSTNPKDFVRKVESKVTQAVQKSLGEKDRMSQRQQELQRTAASLAQDFPEITQQDHEMYSKVIEIHNSLPQDQRESVLGYRTAVLQAAAELGVLPKAKRGKSAPQGEDFTMSGTKGTPSKSQRPKGQDAKISAETEAFAALVGIDIQDPEKRKRLEERSKRSYRKWR